MDFQDKWSFVDKAILEIENIQKIGNSEDIIRLVKLKERLARLRDLKEKIDEKEMRVHLHHLVLLKERNFYLEKWRLIEQIGQENDWQDETGLLQKFTELLESFGAKKT